MAAETEMRPVAEGQVTRAGSSRDDLVGAVEHLGIAVGRRQGDPYDRSPAKVVAGNVHIAARSANESVGWRLQPEELIHHAVPGSTLRTAQINCRRIQR